jgi:hypothetical protein
VGEDQFPLVKKSFPDNFGTKIKVEVTIPRGVKGSVLRYPFPDTLDEKTLLI